MNKFLILAFLFSAGSLIGWGIEVIFRRFFSAKKWINPGFLIGPSLPIYGFCLCILYIVAGFDKFIPIEKQWLQKLILFVIMAVSITGVEYIAGMIFIKRMKIKLWDYSERFGNIRGIICPEFSFYWMILSAVYYFGVHPHVIYALEWLSENLAFSFFIGMFYGVFIIDLVYSANLMTKIRRFANENDIIMKYEGLKEHIHEFKKENKEKLNFLLTMHSSLPILQHLRNYYDAHKREYKK